MSGQKALDTFEVMPLDVYEGGLGHIVLRQEWTTPKGEEYLRVMINARDAEKVAMQILETARKVRGQ